MPRTRRSDVGSARIELGLAPSAACCDAAASSWEARAGERRINANEHRHRRTIQRTLSDASEERAFEPACPSGTDDQRVGFMPLDGGE
jgi:hypothetical protein